MLANHPLKVNQCTHELLIKQPPLFLGFVIKWEAMFEEIIANGPMNT